MTHLKGSGEIELANLLADRLDDLRLAMACVDTPQSRGAVEHTAEAFGMTQVFVGVVLVAIIGNAAEHSTAVLVAMKNQMDLALHIAVGSSLQIALFVAPVLVFAS